MKRSTRNRYFCYVMVFICILLTRGCEDVEINMDITGQIEFPGPSLFGACFSGVYSRHPDEIIITDSKSFQDFCNSLRREINNIDCQSADIPFIDFEKSSLIGKYTWGGGCSSERVRQVIDDKFNKRLIYIIRENYFGGCELMYFSMNWAIIPKPGPGYKVEFRVSQETRVADPQD